MKRSKHHYLSGIIIAATVAIATWVLVTTKNNEQQLQSSKQSNQRDAFMKGAKAYRTNADGKVDNKLHASSVTHYPSSQTTDFSSPHYIIYDPPKKPWHITANFGRAYEQQQKIELWGNVKLHQDKGPKNPEITIITEKISYYPKRQYAETDQPIEMTQTGLRVKSVGVRAYLKEGRVELLSKTRGNYEMQ